MHKIIFIASLLLSCLITKGQQGVKIAPTVGTPDPSAMLEIENGADQKGVLITRVILTDRSIAAPINAPANSLLVFNTNFTGNNFNDVQPGYYYWDTDSTKWIRLITAQSSDDQNIDSISLVDDELTIYIEDGNSANIDLSPIKDHDWYEVGTTESPNSINDSIFTYGNVGIGTNSPTYILETSGANSDASINNIRVGRGGGDLITNTVVGNNALTLNTTGNNNIAVGTSALSANTTGIHNNALGVSALQNNLTGRGNVAVGINTLQSNTTGDFNIAFGETALQNNTDGTSNIGIGLRSLRSNVNGSNNIGIGTDAIATSVGNSNIGLGHLAGFDVTSSSNGIYIGNSIRGDFVGDNNIVIGTKNYSIASPENTSALASSNSIFINSNTGTERIRVNNLGNMGVGAFDPTHKLDVNGELRVRSILDTLEITNLLSANANGVIKKLAYDSLVSYLRDSIKDADWYQAGTSNSPYAINDSIYTLGHVGVGTNSPAKNLHIQSDTGDVRILIAADPSNNAAGENWNSGIEMSQDGGLVKSYFGYVHSGGNNIALNNPVVGLATLNPLVIINNDNGTNGVPIQFGIRDTIAMTVANNRNIGIGTSNPSNKLTINGNSSIINGSLGFNRNPSDGTVPVGGINSGGKYQLTYQPGYISLESYQQNSLTANGNLMLDTNGYVGIATTTPQGRLDVEASNLFYLGRNDANARIIASDGTNLQFKPPVDGNQIQFMDGNTNNSIDVTVASEAIIQVLTPVSGTGDLAIVTDPAFGNDGDVIFRGGATSAENVRIKGSGNMGVGIANPEEKLIVNGTGRFAGEASLDDPNALIHIEISSNAVGDNNNQVGADRQFRILTETNLQSAGRDWLVFEGLDGNEVDQDGGFIFRGRGNTGVKRDIMAVVSRLGRVGIGTLAPTETLHVNGSARLGLVTPAGAGTGAGYGETLFFSGGPTNPIFGSDNSDPIWMARYNAGVDSSELRLNIGDNNASRDIFNVGRTDAGGWTPTLSAITSLGRVGINTDSPSEALEVVGNIIASGTITPSDSNYKEHVNTLNNALENTLKLRGVTYQMKDEYIKKGFGEGNQIGVIAQEIEKVYPELVKTNESGYKGVDYSKFTPILIEAIKEQQAIIESLKDKNNQLMDDNNVLKASLKDQEKTDDNLQKQIDELKEILNQTSSK